MSLHFAILLRTGQIDKFSGEQTNEWTDGRTDKSTYGRIEGWRDEGTGGQAEWQNESVNHHMRKVRTALWTGYWIQKQIKKIHKSLMHTLCVQLFVFLIVVFECYKWDKQISIFFVSAIKYLRNLELEQLQSNKQVKTIERKVKFQTEVLYC